MTINLKPNFYMCDYDKNEFKNHFSHGTLRSFHAIVNKMKLRI